MKTALRTIACVVFAALVAGAVLYLRPLWVGDQTIRFRLWREGARSEYVDVDGYRMHYFEAVPKHSSGGVPVLLIHGLGARGEDWAALIPALAAQGYHVYAPDLLGYGRSPKPDVSYSIAMQETVVTEFMRAMHLTRVDLGGWSMGGWVVMKLTLDHPELVDRLMIYDSAGVYFHATWQPDLFTPHDAAGLRQLMSLLSPKPANLPGFAVRAALRKLKGNSWVLSRSMSEMMKGRDLLDFRVHEIKQPMLIVWGEKDDLIPIAAGEAIHKNVPQSVFSVIQGCGHLAPAECPKPVIESTVEFLKSDPPLKGIRMTFPPGQSER